MPAANRKAIIMPGPPPISAPTTRNSPVSSDIRKPVLNRFIAGISHNSNSDVCFVRHRVKQLMDTPKKASSPEEIAARLAEAAKRANAEAEARRAAEKPAPPAAGTGRPQGSGTHPLWRLGEKGPDFRLLERGPA